MMVAGGGVGEAALAVTGGVYHLLEAGYEHAGGRGGTGGHVPVLDESLYGGGSGGSSLVVGSIGTGGGGLDTGGTSQDDLDQLAALWQELMNPGGAGAASGGGIVGNMNFTSGNFSDIGIITLQQRPLSVKAIVGLLLGAFGLLANLSSLIAISQIRNSLTANLRLIVSLCASDMLVSMSILAKLTHEAHSYQLNDIEDTCLEHVLKALRMTSHIISLLNLVGLALDHYCAILKPLNYPTLMCKKHANIMIVLFWIAASLCGFSDFILPSAYFSYCNGIDVKHYCMAVWCSIYTEEYIMFAMAILSSILMVILYTTIFVQIRRYQAFQQQYRQNMKRNRRGLVTTFVIVFTFMITWLPYCLFDVIIIIANTSNSSTDSSLHYVKVAKLLECHFFNLLLLNSFLDPIIYAIRMREVQNGYRNIFPCTRVIRGLNRGASQSTERSTRYTIHNSTVQYSKTNQAESYL